MASKWARGAVSARQSRKEPLGGNPLELQTRPESARPTRYDLAPSLRLPHRLVGGPVEVGPRPTDLDCYA